MEISVIMACYNEKLEWVEDSINSVLNQDIDSFEIIIVSDNPKNLELNNLIKEYELENKQIRAIYNKENIGLTKSLNKAVRLSNGEYIARIDADDICNQGRLRKQYTYLKENKDIEFIFSGAELIDEKGNIIGKSDITNIDDIKKFLKIRNISYHPTWMFKKDVFDKLEGYNEVKYCEDYDFICRAIIMGVKVEFMPQHLIKYRIRNTSISRQKTTEQSIYSNLVRKEFSRALKRGEYHLTKRIDNIKDYKIDKYKKYDYIFYKGKNKIKEKKFLEGSLCILNALINSRLKREQLVCNIKYKLARSNYGK